MSSEPKITKPGGRRFGGLKIRSLKRPASQKGQPAKMSSKDDAEVARSGGESRVRSVILVAQSVGLLKGKDSRITGRVSADLVREAKAKTGIESDTDLIEFALANVAIEDGFAEAFRATKATVPREIELEF